MSRRIFQEGRGLRNAGLATALLVVVIAACATLRDSSAAPVQAACRSSDGVGWSPASGDSISLNAWCAGVGPAAVVAPDTSAHATDSVLVVTWNTHVGGGDIDALVRDIRSGALTGTSSRSFVLLLQEVYRGGDNVPAYSRTARGSKRIAHAPAGGSRTDIVATASRLGLNLFYAPSMRNGGAGTLPEDRGNAILSNIPMAKYTALELPFEAQRRVIAASTLTMASRTGEPWSLRVVSVHLDTRSRLARGIASLGSARARQGRAIAAIAANEGNAIVAGDLNTWSLGALEGAPRELAKEFPDLPEGDMEGTFVVAGLLPRRLDHMFARLGSLNATPPVRIDDRYGSDHYPLAVLLTVRPSSPASPPQ